MQNKTFFYFFKGKNTKFFEKSFQLLFIFVKINEKKVREFVKNLKYFSPFKIRPWIGICIRIPIHIQTRIRICFKNPGSGSARNGCGSETLLGMKHTF